MEVVSASEPKRQKLEKNMYDNDESVPIAERLKSIREDISQCFSKWKEFDQEQKMEKVDDVFKKVHDRLNNFVLKLPSGMTQLFFDDFVREYNQLKDLADLLRQEHKAFMSCHRRKCMGTEFRIRLLELYKIEKKTKKLLDYPSNRSTDIYIYSLLSTLPDVLDENELADDNDEADADYVVIREEMIRMINCFEKGREVGHRLYNFVSCLRSKIQIMGVIISKMGSGGCES